MISLPVKTGIFTTPGNQRSCLDRAQCNARQVSDLRSTWQAFRATSPCVDRLCAPLVSSGRAAICAAMGMLDRHHT